jgi:hypothetical protein
MGSLHGSNPAVVELPGSAGCKSRKIGGPKTSVLGTVKIGIEELIAEFAAWIVVLEQLFIIG